MLDIRTLLLVLMLGNLVMASTLWLAYHGRFGNGLTQWTWGLIVQSVAWGLFAMRDHAPDLVTVSTPHALLALSLCLHAAALIEFRQRRSPPLPLLFVPPLLAFLALEALPGNLLWRVIVSSAVCGTCATLIVMLLLRDQTEGTARTRWLMSGVYGLAALALFARIPLWLIDPARTLSISQPTPVQSAALLFAVAAVLLVSFGFLLMQKERSDEANLRLATTDPLTGVFNRRTFFELAARELARCRRNGEPLRLLMIDLDHFKRVNDTHGHGAGDDVLAGFARAVSSCLRRSDLFVRYGGEEFSVLLPGADEVAAAVLAERIRSTVDGARFATRAGPVHVTVSVGICGDHAAAIMSLDTLLGCADAALYRAKKAGRNRVVNATLSGKTANAA